jgi:hypothetical protein
MQLKRQTDLEENRRLDAERNARVAVMKKEADEKAAKQAAEIKEKLAAEKKAAPANGPEDTWTKDQQAQIQEGMRTFGADLPTKERWVSIAKSVDEKTPKQCYERFRVLCAKAKVEK